MDHGFILELGRQAMMVAFLVMLPILAVALFVGVLISVFQAVTQVQEMTLTFVPKLICVGLTMLLMGSWMLSTLVGFTQACFLHVAEVTREL